MYLPHLFSKILRRIITYFRILCFLLFCACAPCADERAHWQAPECGLASRPGCCGGRRRQFSWRSTTDAKHKPRPRLLRLVSRERSPFCRIWKRLRPISAMVGRRATETRAVSAMNGFEMRMLGISGINITTWLNKCQDMMDLDISGSAL
jgi:hypothetical protein